MGNLGEIGFEIELGLGESLGEVFIKIVLLGNNNNN